MNPTTEYLDVACQICKAGGNGKYLRYKIDKKWICSDCYISSLKDKLKSEKICYSDLSKQFVEAKSTISRRNTQITDLRGQINSLEKQLKHICHMSGIKYSIEAVRQFLGIYVRPPEKVDF